MISTIGSKFGIFQNQVSRTEPKKAEVSVGANIEDKGESKVARISKAIADGSYKIDMAKTARAIADEII